MAGSAAAAIAADVRSGGPSGAGPSAPAIRTDRVRAMTSNKQPKTRLYFRWECADVLPKQEVRVVGGCAELGNWEPSMGVLLTNHEREKGCWTSPCVTVPIGAAVEYKYIKCGRGGTNAQWEERLANRTITPTGRRLVVEDDEGKYRHIEVEASQWSPMAQWSPTGQASIAGADAGVEEPKSPNMPRLQSFEDKRKREAELSVLRSDHVVVVFRLLPVRLEKVNGTWSVELDADTIVLSVPNMLFHAMRGHEGAPKITYVGHPGVFTEDREDQEKIKEALAPYSCIPVFLDPQVYARNMTFCNNFLWPVMHNMKVFDDDESRLKGGLDNAQKFDEASWKNFQLVNRTYAETAEAQCKDGSFVWVHDFYMLLVPRALKLSVRRITTTVGFFMHSAFPSSEVLRCLPTREEILQSLLSCQVVTFQVFEYARHFLTCCQMTLNAAYAFQGTGVLHVQHQKENVQVRADHFVLPAVDFETRMQQQPVQEESKAIRAQYVGDGGPVLFVSIDGDEPFAGLVLKLRAFQRFLAEYRDHAHKVRLLQQVSCHRTGKNQQESEIVKEVRRVADEINAAYGKPGQPPVVIRTGELTVDQRLALLQAADVYIDTSINDGLNLHPFLFCCSHSKDGKGAIIVSEFTGCSNVLTGAVKVNPWNTQAVTEAMYQVITMNAVEKERRFTKDHSYVKTQNLSEWAMQNFVEMKQLQAGAHKQDGPIKGLGAGSRLLFMEQGFQHLSFEAVVKDYRLAKNRAIFLDNEGTLAPDRLSAIKPYGAQEDLQRMGTAPDPQVLESLQALIDDKHNHVSVVSGRASNVLDQWFGSVDGLGLCAEHGYCWVPPGKVPVDKRPAADKPVERWVCNSRDTKEDEDWKSIVTRVMKMYVKRVQGSVMEQKGSCITWNYRKVAVQQLVEEMAMELGNFLDPKKGLLQGYPVKVGRGKGYVEVKRNDIDKGKAVERVLQDLGKTRGKIDFVLCIGDDRSDEDMFEVVNSLSNSMGDTASMFPEDEEFGEFSATGGSRKLTGDWASGNSLFKKQSLTLDDFNPADMSKRSQYYTATVGRKPSIARYFVNDVDEVSVLLQKLAMASKVEKLSRFSSMPMLAGLVDND